MECIGLGGSSQVWKVVEEETEKIYALKIIPKEDIL
jgi:hypothetical protein